MPRRIELERALDPPRAAYERWLSKQQHRTERLWEEATGRCWRCRKDKAGCGCDPQRSAA